MKHLLLDDQGIELQDGLERRWHQPVKHGPPVLAPEGPLEMPRLHIWNPPLPSDDGGWRMWYIGGEELHPVHATSADGIEWGRPKLGLIEADGGRDNNIVSLGFDASPKERRLVLCEPGAENAVGSRYYALTRVGSRLLPLTSADGLTWHYHADHPGVPSNDEYRLAYDRDTSRLIATVKRGGSAGVAPFGVPELGRAVSLSVSEDGQDWSETEIIFHSDHHDRLAGAEAIERHLADDALVSPLFVDPDYRWSDIYNMPVFRYEGLYLGLPVLFHQCGAWQHPGRPDNTNQDGLLWPCLAWSRDLRRWERPAVREPFIPLSPCTDAASFDHGSIHACAPVRRGDELWFYYYGSRLTHISIPLAEQAGLLGDGTIPVGAIFLARLRLDGFCSLHAGDAHGCILTRPMTVDGATLRINADARCGEIRAEIRDAESGRAIPGFGMGDAVASRRISFPDGRKLPRGAGWGTRFEDDQASDDAIPFSGNAVDAPLSWRGGSDLSSLRGRSVRLFVALRNADLYAFGFGDD